MDRVFLKLTLVTAREYGFPSWPRLKRHVEEFSRASG